VGGALYWNKHYHYRNIVGEVYNPENHKHNNNIQATICNEKVEHFK